MTLETANPEFLLTTNQMASFSARGFLRFDQLVPLAVNRRIMEFFDAGAVERPQAGVQLADAYELGSPLHELMSLPQIQGIVHSRLALIHGLITTQFISGNPTRAVPKDCMVMPLLIPEWTLISS